MRVKRVITVFEDGLFSYDGGELEGFGERSVRRAVRRAVKRTDPRGRRQEGADHWRDVDDTWFFAVGEPNFYHEGPVVDHQYLFGAHSLRFSLLGRQVFSALCSVLRSLLYPRRAAPAIL